MQAVGHNPGDEDHAAVQGAKEMRIEERYVREPGGDETATGESGLPDTVRV